jgi:hypothetical protein
MVGLLRSRRCEEHYGSRLTGRIIASKDKTACLYSGLSQKSQNAFGKAIVYKAAASHCLSKISIAGSALP